MKSTINNAPSPRKPEYPCLMSARAGLVVLFTEPQRGTVVHGNDVHAVGGHGTTWAMHLFTPFYGEIVLSND